MATLWAALTRNPGQATLRPCGCYWDPLVFGHCPGHRQGCGGA